MKAKFQRKKAAFSLVEVLLALVVVSTLMISVFSLIGVAASNIQSQTSLTAESAILSQIASDIRSTAPTATTTPYFQITLPAAGTAATSLTPMYLDANFAVTPTVTGAMYQVNYWATGSTATNQESIIRIIISSPAPALYTNAQSSVETVIAFDHNL